MASADQPVPEELLQLTDLVMSGTTSGSSLRSAVVAAEQAIARRSPEDNELHLARLRFLEGFASLGAGDITVADEFFERSADHARRSIRQSESSEGYRVLADALNQLLNIRSTGYRILNAGRARRAAEDAVELDATNPLAHIASAAYLTAAPAIGGGDVGRAWAHLQSARTQIDGSDYQEFLLLVWEGRNLAARGRTQAARESFAGARAIYPQSWWLLSEEREAGL